MGLDELNKEGLAIIEANASALGVARWKEIVQEENTSVNGINGALTTAKEKIEQKEKEGYHKLWKQLNIYLTSLKDSTTNAASTGLSLLPEAAVHGCTCGVLQGFVAND